MITFVTWKWDDANNGRNFECDHVNVVADRVRVHYPKPHRFVCITDDPVGLDSRIEPLPLPVTGLERLVSPAELRRQENGKKRAFPSCYRRLWNFSPDARRLLGPRIFALDIDVIICGDLRPLADRSASFVGWSDPRFGWNKVAGGCYLMTTGAHTNVWDDFDPATSPELCKHGNHGSDQAWMSYKLYPPPDRWTTADGIFKINWLPEIRGRSTLPPHARLVFTSGDQPPWSADQQKRHPWIKEHWQ